MRVLLLGGGGREHALGWSLTRNPDVALVAAPGNPGLAEIATIDPDVALTDPVGVARLAARYEVDLVVVGPEAPLAAGVADELRRNGAAVFGPSRAAAQLEASKQFANEVMSRAGVPTGAAHAFDDVDGVHRHLDAVGGPFVVKADGLAAGKGVLVTPERDAAKAWAAELIDGKFGGAGSTVVVEDFLEGREVSVFAVCDGTSAVPLQPARDYKRLLDGDAGPNTGGMGCFSPVDDLPEDLVPWTMEHVVRPVMETMAGDGAPFVGFLYAGLMLTDDGPKVLEFNVRLGDPETQVVLPRLESDLAGLLLAAATGRLRDDPLEWSPRAAVDVVLASEGYPESPVTGRTITGLESLGERDDVLVFHAGTAKHGERLVASGGRVLNIVGMGDDVATARAIAYGAAASVEFEGKQFRSDIAERKETTS